MAKKSTAQESLTAESHSLHDSGSLALGKTTDAKRAIEILDEALSGTSPKSKNALIKDAIKAIRRIK